MSLSFDALLRAELNASQTDVCEGDDLAPIVEGVPSRHFAVGQPSSPAKRNVALTGSAALAAAVVLIVTVLLPPDVNASDQSPNVAVTQIAADGNERQPKKYPIPSPEFQRQVGARIEDTYKISQAKTSEAKLQLAKGLFEVAKGTKKPEEQYALLRKAAELACAGGDASLMLETLAAMTGAFVIDSLSVKAAMLERFAKSPRNPARVQSLVQGSHIVIDEAVAEDRYEIAANLAKLAAEACARSSPQLRKETADRRKRVLQLQKQFQEVEKSLTALKEDPRNPYANLTGGKYLCFSKGDWKKGLSMLALGGDPSLSALAERDLKGPATPEEQAALADAWWGVEAIERAVYWYEQALSGISGIERDRIDKRLSDADVPLPRILAKDVHDGSAGAKPNKNIYVLTSSRSALLGRTLIQYEACAERKNPAAHPSNGVILVSLDGQSWAEAGQWTSQDLEMSQKRGDFLNVVNLASSFGSDKRRVREIRVRFQFMTGTDALTIRGVTWLSQ